MCLSLVSMLKRQDDGQVRRTQLNTRGCSTTETRGCWLGPEPEDGMLEVCVRAGPAAAPVTATCSRPALGAQQPASGKRGSGAPSLSSHCPFSPAPLLAFSLPRPQGRIKFVNIASMAYDPAENEGILYEEAMEVGGVVITQPVERQDFESKPAPSFCRWTAWLASRAPLLREAPSSWTPPSAVALTLRCTWLCGCRPFMRSSGTAPS